MSGLYFPYSNCFLDNGNRNADDDQSEAHAFGRKSQNGACLTKSRCLKLNFLNDISRPVVTGIPFEKQGIILEIALIDAANDNVVKHGPEASAIVEIVVLSKDYNCNEEKWTLEEFNSRIVKGADGRDAKKSLLGGKLHLPLKEGIASLSKIFFRHTRQYTRKNEFRLGARMFYSNDAGVREAKTKPFTVKDRRIMSKKCYPPSLDDEVWRLEKIGKGGPYHRRLRERNIETVKDFLTEFTKNPEKLRNILQMTKSSTMWEATVNHAQTCRLGTTKYVCSYPNSQPRMGVVFNVVNQVLGLYSESKFIPIDQLSHTQKAHAHELMASANEHWDEVVSFDDNAFVLHGSSLLSSTQNLSYSGNISNHGGNDIGISYVVESKKQGELSTSVLSPDHLTYCGSALNYYGHQMNDDMGFLYHIPSWSTVQHTYS
ncbi:hypothetical protein Pfo_011208 [Paulownia fortunei]|nr:hypothetical protein Pfo_011208 [Paulownia fortunei]